MGWVSLDPGTGSIQKAKADDALLFHIYCEAPSDDIEQGCWYQGITCPEGGKYFDMAVLSCIPMLGHRCFAHEYTTQRFVKIGLLLS